MEDRSLLAHYESQEKWGVGAFSWPDRSRSFYLDVATPTEISTAIHFQPSSQSSGSSLLVCQMALVKDLTLVMIAV